MPYTTYTKVSTYLLLEIAEGYQSTVEEFIAAVSREMDLMANRKLVANGKEIKYYDGEGLQGISIDDCQDIETLEVGDRFGENLTAVTNYITYPKIPPFRSIILKSGIFTHGIQNIAIEGSFGLFSAVPADIEWACTVLVAGIVNNQTNVGQISSEKIGNYAVSFDTEIEKQDFARAREIINSYRKTTF